MLLLQGGLGQPGICAPFVSRHIAIPHLPRTRTSIICSSSRENVERAQSSKEATNRNLLVSLAEQVRKETLPWVADLVEPLIAGPPEPLQDTVPPQQLGDPDSRWIEVDGVNLHYKDTGPQAPGAPAVLLLHGFNGSVFSWRTVMDPVSRAAGSCRVIAFDRPPFGLTERPLTWTGGDANSPYSAQGGARLAAGLLDKLGVGQAVVVGHSAGGLTALELYRRAPEKVRGLVLVAPAVPTNNPKNSWSRRGGLGRTLRLAATRAILQLDGPGLHYIRRSYRKQAASIAQGNLKMITRETPEAKQDIIDGYLKPMRSHDWDKGSLLSMRVMSFPSSFPYDSIKVPVHIIIGEDDTFLLKTAKEVSSLLEQRQRGSTQMTVYPTCGHVPMDECPGQFEADLISFVESVYGRQDSMPISKQEVGALLQQ
ncbi:g5609 [Coccomyxa elongata]